MKNKSNLDVEKFIKHLETKWGADKPCPMCGSKNWVVSDKVYELREYHGGNIVIGGSPIVPIIPVSCDNCGNTIMVNPLISNTLKLPNVEPKKTKENDK